VSLNSSFARMVSRLRSWFRAVSRRNRLEAEMDAELADHLGRLTEDLIRAGKSPAEAARNARIALGAIMVNKEEMRASLGLRWWDELGADLRYAARLLRKSPGFTGIATLSLALAIGANTTIFSIAKQVMYDRLGVPHPGELRLLTWVGDQNVAVHSAWGNFEPGPEGQTSPDFTYPVYEQLQKENRSLGNLFAFKDRGMNATIRGNARQVQTEMVSGNYYAELGIHPQIGRTIQPSDDAAIGAGTVALISDGLWEREFARSPAVLGQTITLNQSVVTIAGVNPRGFTGVDTPQISPDVFVPLSMQPLISPLPSKAPSLLVDPDTWWIVIMARAKPGVNDADAQSVLNAQMQAAIRATVPIKAGETVPHLRLTDGSRGTNYVGKQFGKPVNVLLALTGFVLLLACANIANLLLARGANRQREMNVRLAMGAGRARILRQMLTESLLLAAIGGLAGLAVGYAGRSAVPSLLFNSWDEGGFAIPFDWGVFGFAAGVTILTGLVFGLAPAWSAARSEVSSSLKDAAQTTTRRRKGLGGKAIVAFQIALSTLLVVGAGLFLRTVFALNSVDVGFRTDHLLLFDVQPPAKSYPEGKDVQLYARLDQAIAALPGVESVTPAQVAYIADNMSKTSFVREGEKYNPKGEQGELLNVVGENFFATLGIPIVAGRGFGPQDTATSPKVAVINQSLARKRFPHENPIGKRFTSDEKAKDRWTQIVGICADTRYNTLREAPPAQFMVPYLQNPGMAGMTFEIRTRREPAALVPSLRQAVQKIDRDLPILDVRTQQEQIDATAQMERIFAALTTGFGLLALALACVGIYGIMAYSVTQRTNEIGIRLALGARPAQVRGMILRESTWIAIAGVLVGLGAAVALVRMVRSMLFGIQPWDPATLAAGAAVLLAVALAASWIPARRAAGVQPMEALRHE
jgi:predicted permease